MSKALIITKNNSQGIIIVIISCQRVALGNVNGFFQTGFFEV